MQKSPLHEEVCVPEETTAGLWGPLPDSHVVLFLDFDGVCHRCKNETFERMPLVEKLLDKCPSMVIVISSSWRECASMVIPPFFGALKSRGHAACAKRCFGV